MKVCAEFHYRQIAEESLKFPLCITNIQTKSLRWRPSKRELELEIWWVTGIVSIIFERIVRFLHILEDEKQEFCFRKCQHETMMYSTWHLYGSQLFFQAFLEHRLG